MSNKHFILLVQFVRTGYWGKSCVCQACQWVEMKTSCEGVPTPVTVPLQHKALQFPEPVKRLCADLSVWCAFWLQLLSYLFILMGVGLCVFVCIFVCVCVCVCLQIYQFLTCHKVCRAPKATLFLIFGQHQWSQQETQPERRHTEEAHLTMNKLVIWSLKTTDNN